MRFTVWGSWPLQRRETAKCLNETRFAGMNRIEVGTDCIMVVLGKEKSLRSVSVQCIEGCYTGRRCDLYIV